MLSRRTLLYALPMATLSQHALLAARHGSGATHLYVGTGTDKASTSKGIYLAPWNATTGQIGPLTLAAELPSPTWLALAPKSAHLYALSETDNAKVTAFSIEPGTFALTRINESSAKGPGAAHVAVNHDGRSAFVANYAGGSLTSFRVEPSGALSAPVSHFQYTPSDDTPEHQHPHAHQATPSPDGRWLIVNDLGLDRLLVYRIDQATGALTANDPPFWSTRRKAGPRHVAFHPNGRWLYNVNELDSTVDLLYWDTRQGTLTLHGGFVSTLAPDFPKNTSHCSEILLSPDGHFVYVGNRGSETIAVFGVSPADGTLTMLQLAPHGGKTARHVTLDPTGKWLLVAQQDSNGIAVLSRDPATGKLSAPVHTFSIDSPQCLVFPV